MNEDENSTLAIAPFFPMNPRGGQGGDMSGGRVTSNGSTHFVPGSPIGGDGPVWTTKTLQELMDQLPHHFGSDYTGIRPDLPPYSPKSPLLPPPETMDFFSQMSKKPGLDNPYAGRAYGGIPFKATNPDELVGQTGPRTPFDAELYGAVEELDKQRKLAGEAMVNQETAPSAAEKLEMDFQNSGATDRASFLALQQGNLPKTLTPGQYAALLKGFGGLNPALSQTQLALPTSTSHQPHTNPTQTGSGSQLVPSRQPVVYAQNPGLFRPGGIQGIGEFSPAMDYYPRGPSPIHSGHQDGVKPGTGGMNRYGNFHASWNKILGGASHLTNPNLGVQGGGVGPGKSMNRVLDSVAKTSYGQALGGQGFGKFSSAKPDASFAKGFATGAVAWDPLLAMIAPQKYAAYGYNSNENILKAREAIDARLSGVRDFMGTERKFYNVGDEVNHTERGVSLVRDLAQVLTDSGFDLSGKEGEKMFNELVTGDQTFDEWQTRNRSALEYVPFFGAFSNKHGVHGSGTLLNAAFTGSPSTDLTVPQPGNETLRGALAGLSATAGTGVQAVGAILDPISGRANTTENRWNFAISPGVSEEHKYRQAERAATGQQKQNNAARYTDYKKLLDEDSQAQQKVLWDFVSGLNEQNRGKSLPGPDNIPGTSDDVPMGEFGWQYGKGEPRTDYDKMWSEGYSISSQEDLEYAAPDRAGNKQAVFRMGPIDPLTYGASHLQYSSKKNPVSMSYKTHDGRTMLYDPSEPSEDVQKRILAFEKGELSMEEHKRNAPRGRAR